MLLFVFLALLSVASSTAVENLNVECYSNGSYQILLSGDIWFRSGPLWVRDDGKWWGKDDNTLVLKKNYSDTGNTPIGTYTRCGYMWEALNGMQVVTYVDVFDELPAIMFGIAYQTEATNTSVDTLTSGIISTFPSFFIEETSTERGYLTWSGNMAATINIGKWSPSDYIYGDVDGGFPLVVFDSKLENTVVLSPWNAFMAANQISFTDSTTGGKVLSFGPLGSITEVPAGYDYGTLLIAGQNVTGTMHRFGEIMKVLYQKDCSYRRSDFTINYLGYWTDNGACYYYNPGSYPNYEETLVAVKEDADKQNIPYRYVQIDSWWYYKGSDGGVTKWTATPDVFPNGIQAVVNRTGWPIMAHNRWWSNETVYAKQNGGDYDFILGEKAALPLDATFWDYLLSSSKKEWHLLVYEQDWLYVEFSDVNQLQSSTNLSRMWLLQMGDAAQRYGLTIQYCMPWPRHLLQSIEIPVVTQTRTSDDYSPPGKDQWKIGITTILANALGLAAFKDTFHTTSVEKGCYNLQNEPSPALQTYVAALSGGPIGPSDHVGMANRTLILATCMSDGRLLKPTHPAMSVDSTFVRRAFGSGGPDGELWVAFSEVNWLTWYYIIAAELNEDYTLTTAELPPSHSTHPQTFFPESIAFQYTLDGTVTKYQPFDSKLPLAVQKCNKTDFQYWGIAPVLNSGWAILGELNKVIPVSETRFEMFMSGNMKQKYFANLRGVPGEEVMVTVFKEPTSFQVKCVIGASGTAFLTVPGKDAPGVCTDGSM